MSAATVGLRGDCCDSLTVGRCCHRQTFYEKFFDDIRDDQLWGCGSRHSDGGSTCGGQTDAEAKGSVADVTPYDGIGGWPGCPVWQVAYIVIARNYWHH